MSNRIDGKNVEQIAEEMDFEMEDDQFDDLEDEYGEEPTYERMNKQRGLRKMKW